MELVKLNDERQPAGLVENYDSLIWTERFNASLGEFQLQSGSVDKFMTLLPEGQLVTLRETNVPMIVETHLIERKKNQPQILTIKGRAFESILDRRAAIKALIAGAVDWSVIAKIPSDVAHYIITKICVEGLVTAADIFPPDLVQFLTPSDYLTSTGPNRQYTIPRGNLLTAVMAFLQTASRADATTIPPTPEVLPHGIRSIRPDQNGTAIGIEIYHGTDRSDKVYFNASRDLLDDGSYLFSKLGSATDAYILGQSTAFAMSKGLAEATGMDRRVILVDGSAAGITNEASLIEQGKMSLSEAHETAMFDGSINQELSAYTYGVDYFLGDVVKLVGDYGLEEKARVTEFIRSEDKTGRKAYPTLSTIDE